MSDERACVNTDRELWRETPGDYYAPRVFVTAGGGIGIGVGGFVIVKPVRDWHALASAPSVPQGWQPIASAPNDVESLMVASSTGDMLIGRWGNYCWYNKPKFTHWMPLPPGPWQNAKDARPLTQPSAAPPDTCDDLCMLPAPTETQEETCERCEDIYKLAKVLRAEDIVAHAADGELSVQRELRLFATIASLQVELAAVRGQPGIVQAACSAAAKNLVRAEAAEARVRELEAQPSPETPDAITAAVDAQLDPLKRELVDFGRKLVVRQEGELVECTPMRQFAKDEEAVETPTIADMNPWTFTCNGLSHCFFCKTWRHENAHAHNCIWQAQQAPR